MKNSVREQLRQTLVEQIAPSFRPSVPLEEQRQVLDAMGAAAPPDPELEIRRGELAGMACERLLGPNASESHAILHLHGGGYVMGSCASHRALTGHVAKASGVQGILPEYRLAPEHPFPAAIEDAVRAYRALLAEGFAAEQLILLGDSAGGGLTLAALHVLRDAGDPMPAAAVLLSPYTDLTYSGETMKTRLESDPWLDPTLFEPLRDLYIGEADPADPRVSPLFADQRGLPPLLIHVGDHEVLLADSTRLAERAQAAGVDVELEIWPEVWHVFHLFAPALPEANEALAKIGAFIRARLGLDDAAS